MLRSVAPLPRSEVSVSGGALMLMLNTSFTNADAGATVLVSWSRDLVCVPTTGMPVVWHASGPLALNVSAAAGDASNATAETNEAARSTTDVTAAPNLVRMP